MCHTLYFKILAPVWHTLCFTILAEKAPKVAIGMPAAQENGTDRIHGRFQRKGLAHEWSTPNVTSRTIALDRWQICTSLAHKWSRSISQGERVFLTPMHHQKKRIFSPPLDAPTSNRWFLRRDYGRGRNLVGDSLSHPHNQLEMDSVAV